MIDFDRAKREIKEHIVAEESREEHAEIHTPADLIGDMLDEIPEHKFSDPHATFLDPCAGIGNFPLHVAERLVANGISYEHAMEEQIYMVELQPKNCIKIEEILNPTDDLNLNLKCCDALELEVKRIKPADWKSERFRTDFSNTHSFFERKVKPEERERLKKTLRLCEDEKVAKRFANGYDVDVDSYL